MLATALLLSRHLDSLTNSYRGSSLTNARQEALSCVGVKMAERYRTRQSVDPEYLHAIGQAVYSFSILEWQVVWAAEQISPGFINTDHHTMTAGQISRQFREILKRKKDEVPEEIWCPLKGISDRLWDAVDMRKALLHAHPFTGPEGAAMLGRRTEAGAFLHWGIDKIDAAARFFDELSGELNSIFYQSLYPIPVWRTSAPSNPDRLS